MNNKTEKDLLDKYLKGDCSEKEQAIVESWYNIISSEQNEPLPKNYESRYNQILSGLPVHKKKGTKVSKLWYRVTAAAIIIIFGVSTSYYILNNSGNADGEHKYANNIAPGKSGATLTLDNGEKIFINDLQAGVVTVKSGIQIKVSEDGTLIYETKQSNTDNIEYNTLETTRGEQTKVILPDGSKVWLNAASTLKYATAVNVRGERRVELIGEAYFEVLKDKLHPFIVKTHKQEINVLGTSFNVSAYADESVTATSLHSGSVKISSPVGVAILKPGQMGLTYDNSTEIYVKDFDINEVALWKSGQFSFENDDIKTVMRKISRWYNVDVVYQGKITDKDFSGTISRYKNISEVLNMLKLTGLVNFKINERRITVMP